VTVEGACFDDCFRPRTIVPDGDKAEVPRVDFLKKKWINPWKGLINKNPDKDLFFPSKNPVFVP
jgi:hypothetical protein